MRSCRRSSDGRPDLHALIDDALAADPERELTGRFVFEALHRECCVMDGWNSVLKFINGCPYRRG
jgi:hypothetical protein